MRSFHTLMIKVKMLGYKNLPLSSSFDWWLTFLLVGWGSGNKDRLQTKCNYN